MKFQKTPLKTVDAALESFMDDMVNTNRKILAGMEHMLAMEDIDVDTAPKELVYQEDKMRLFHYKPVVDKPFSMPVLICYALVNRQYMMDLQSDRSLVRNLLQMGMDLYIIDWGYPSKMDKFLTMEDYILGYLDHAVDAVRDRTGRDQITLLGVCQGGTFSVCYTALRQEKIKNLICMVTPVDFHTDDGLLNIWSQFLDVDNMVETFGVVPGDFMNIGFLMLKPFQLMLDKYVGMMENLDNKDVVENFMRMEKWIFDSPAQAGEAFRKFIKELYQENRLAKGTFRLGGQPVDLKNITCPVLNIFGEKDHLVPPSSSRPLTELVGSEDTTVFSFPIGHIGIYVSSKSQREIAPNLVKWVKDRSDAPPAAGKKPARKATAPKPKAKAGS